MSLLPKTVSNLNGIKVTSVLCGDMYLADWVHWSALVQAMAYCQVDP